MAEARAALIKGGWSGIGRAIARALGEEGYRLTISARRPDKLEEAARGLADAGIEAQAVPATVARENAISAVAAAHRDRYGRLDVLINNAGIGIGAPIAYADTKKLDL